MISLGAIVATQAATSWPGKTVVMGIAALGIVVAALGRLIQDRKIRQVANG
ncbi:MAG: hypothetical protein J7500_10240 [Sphingomonas sp.]|uniref:hypothetical protein n=1 Tax=Sphingomonas sp. TaxID=28214 RepID=UPI001B0AE351|nr:hypothetical protein [Sphingomonas sp.]MBO9623077.1 hypothetical protein [Sphingomonas sp.]